MSDELPDEWLDYDIQALNSQGQRLAERRRRLLERVTRFRTGLLEGLDLFFQEAKEVGLGGVRPCERKQDTDDILEVALTLNDLPLLLVWVGGAAFRRTFDDFLASEAFVYFEERGLDATPCFWIAVCECGEEDYSWSVSCGPPSSEEIAIDPLMTGSGVDECDGRTAARTLVAFMYRLRSEWEEEPRLGALLRDTGTARKLGISPG